MPRYNGYKSVFTNPWLLRQKNRSFDKGIRQISTKRVNSFIVCCADCSEPLIVIAVVELTPRSKCVYTHHQDLCHATSGVLTSQPPEHANIGMRVPNKCDADNIAIIFDDFCKSYTKRAWKLRADLRN